MSRAFPSTLEEMIRDSNEDWLIDSWQNPAGALKLLRETLNAVQAEAKIRFQGNAPNLTEIDLLREYERNPQRVRAFLQVLGGTRTPAMLLMVWRILQGMEIQDVQVAYHRMNSFHVRVILESPYGDQDPPYESSNIQDFALFRHIGVLEIGGMPVFDGFYPLRIGK